MASSSSATASSTATPSASSPLTPTYDNALHLLSLLQSNKSVVNLFARGEPAAAADLNARAIPEVVAWLKRAGYVPADLARLRCVHVAGTKGKGSVSALAASVLGRYPDVAGRVGLYTSPHLVSVRERILVDGRPIAPDLFARYFFEVWNRLSDAARQAGETAPDGDELGLDGPATKPFYFRFLTIMAFHVFLSEGVKSAVIECGIGGEYDSTNVLPAEAVTVSAITQLGIDHVGMLGDTVEKIAWNKAGIFRSGVPAFTRRLSNQEGVMKVLQDRAEEKGAILTDMGDESVEKWGGVPGAALEGAFQKYNMALAVAIAREHMIRLGHTFEGDFGNNNYQLDSIPDEFREGLSTATLRGRCETIVKDGIQWYLDGAHTADSLAEVGRWFSTKATSKAETVRILIFNQQERDSAGLLRVLLESIQNESKFANNKVFNYAYCPRNDPPVVDIFEPPRDLTVQRRNCKVVRDFCPYTTATPADSISTAVDMAKSIAATHINKKHARVQILVTGSFHLVGPVLQMLDPGDEP